MPPKLKTVTPDKASASVGDTVTFTASLAGDSAPASSYEWTVTGGTVTGDNDEAAITVEADAVGTIKASCQAVNSAGKSNKVSAADVPVTKPKPVITINTDLQAAKETEGTEVSQTVKASIKPSGEALTYAFTVNGSGTLPTGFTATGGTLTAADTVAAATYKVQVTVSSASADPVTGAVVDWVIDPKP